MTHRSDVPLPGTRRDARNDETRPVHRLRRIGAAALAVGTFVGLGALVGPAAVAGATPVDCNLSDSGDNLAGFNEATASGSVTLCDNIEISGGISTSGTLVIDLNGHDLTINGSTGTPGEDGPQGESNDAGDGTSGQPGLINQGTLVMINSGNEGRLTVAGGAGGEGGDGKDGFEGVPFGGDGGNGGNGGIGIANTGTLVLAITSLSVFGGDGGNGGEGKDAYETYGDGGSGGDGGAGASAVENTGTLASALDLAESLQAGSPGGGGSGGDRGDSESHDGSDGEPGNSSVTSLSGTHTARLRLRADDLPQEPKAYNVYAGTTVGSITTILAAAPTSWPTRVGYTLDGWYTSASDGERASDGDSVSSHVTLYARWTADQGNDDHGGGGSPSSQSQSSAPVTTSTAPPVTSNSKPAAPSTTTPPATTTSIPTNNVKNPETFVSSSAPAPQPLPAVSSVNDTSASQFDVDTHSPNQGGDLLLTAKGFQPGTVVDFWMHSTPVYLGSAIADIHGIAVLPVKLDPALVGDHHVQSIGTGLQGEPRNLAQPITIAPTPALASTGVASAPLTFLAVLLLAGGAGLMLADRRRTLHR